MALQLYPTEFRQTVVPVVLWLTCLVFFLNKAVQKYRASGIQLPYPPGPKPIFLIGNILDLPRGKFWETYQAWGKLYNSEQHHPYTSLPQEITQYR